MKVYTKCDSDKIWNIAWINLITTFYVLMTPNWNFFIIPFSVFITSLLHWSNPIHGSYYQTIDIYVVKISALYQLYRAFGAQYMYTYYCFFLCSILSYYMGCYYYVEDFYYKSCYYHIGVHIFANISNIYLYSGYIPPIIFY